MIHFPRRDEKPIDAVIIEDKSPLGNWKKSGNLEFKTVPAGSNGSIESGNVTIGVIEKDAKIAMENGEINVRENKGRLIFLGNTVNGKKPQTQNVARVGSNSGHIHATASTYVSNNTGILKATPVNENDFTIISNTQAKDGKPAASLSVRIVSGKTVSKKVESIFEGEPKNEGVRIYYQDSSIDPRDGNEVFVDVNPDNTITIRQGDNSVDSNEPTEITSALGKLNILARPTMDGGAVVLICGQQELQIVAKVGIIQNVFIRQTQSV